MPSVNPNQLTIRPFSHTQKVLGGLAFALGVVFLLGEYERVGDLRIYLAAAGDFLDGKPIYGGLYGEPALFPYMGSPTLALLLSPLSFLSLPWPALIWKLLNILLLMRIWQLILAYFPADRLEGTLGATFSGASFLAMAFLIYLNFHVVQFSILLLFSILEGLYRIQARQQVLSGALVLSLGIICKVIPLVALPYLAYRGYFKAALLSAGMVLAWMAFPAMVVGWEYTWAQNLAWLQTINPALEDNVFDVSTRSIHGIGALVATLTKADIGNPFTLDIRRHVVDLPASVVVGLITLTKAGLIGMSLYFLQWKSRFSDHRDQMRQLWELSYILAITPLVFPQQRSYGFILLFPAVAYLMYQLFFSGYSWQKGRKALFVLILILLNLELILGHFREYYWHFKTLTYASLMLLGLLAYTPPSQTAKSP
ncbi:MAG: glycosyltransferase family 87 protein [Bacteroidota bacterium]